MSHDWQRSLVTLTSTVVFVALVAVLYLARSILIPVALAVFLAFVLGPVVARLQRRGLGRAPAVILTVGLLILVTAGVGALVTQQVAKLARTLPDRAEAIKEKVTRAKTWLVGDGSTSRLGQLVDDVGAVIVPKRAPDAVVVEQPGPTLTSQMESYVSPAVEILGQGAFAFILTVFMLIKKEDLRNRIIRLMGDGKVTTTTKAVDDASQRISRYLFMQFLINTGFGVLITIGLFILGVDYALLWGLIASVMRYVPYIGTPIGMLPPILYSFATAPEWGGGWGQPLTVLALFVTLELIGNNVFEPWLYGKSMGLSEVAQIVSAGFWAFLWGPIGLVLSGPIMVCLLVLGRHVRRFEFLDVMLGDQPALAPHVAFYQRLAARDQDEAADVALAVAEADGPDAALEAVIVPALGIARRDLDDGDLDPADFQFAVRAAREVVAEVADLRKLPAVSDREERVRVLVVPTRDEAEHVAAEALATALDPTRWEARVAGDEMLASELAEAVEEFAPAVVVLVALLPGGLAHCRYLVSRLRAKHPAVRILVGRWGEAATAEQADGIKGADGLDRNLTDTRKRMADLLPVLAAKEEKDARQPAKLAPVGTAGA
jgi:predicted PurR-regulated permease PerM